MTELSTQEMSNPSGRVPADFHSLLYEAARLWRARSHYGPGDARLGGLFQRAFQLFRADLDRHGSLEVAIDAQGLRAGHSEGSQRLNGLTKSRFVSQYGFLQVDQPCHTLYLMRVQHAFQAWNVDR